MKKSMKQFILCFAVLIGCLMVGNVASAKKVAVDSKHFPDKKVQSAVKKVAKGKKYVETDDVKDLYIKGAKNVKGLGYFTNLESLDLRNYQGTSITLKNEKLTWLVVTGKNVKKANVTKLKNLRTIVMRGIGLRQITGLKNKTKLVVVDMSENKLTKLDVSGCKKLDNLDAAENQLNSLNISGCKKLTWLTLNGNVNLSSVNVSSCKKLQYINVGYTGISSLNVGKHNKLASLYCYNTKVSSLSIPKNVVDLGAFNNNMTYYQLPNQKEMHLYFQVQQSGSVIFLNNYIGTGYSVSEAPEGIYYNANTGLVTVTYGSRGVKWMTLTNGYHTYNISIYCY